MKIRVGQVLKSYCNGFFGRDFYGGRVEAVGFDWIVARRRGIPYMAYFEGDEGIEGYSAVIESWNEYEGEENENFD